jgi:N-acyl-phosphatidylethanolamine-hydrolysing phospholipase D
MLGRPDPPKDIEAQLKLQTPNWGKDTSKDQIKATWIGHACFLVELPAPHGAVRGPRILFDPVFSHRCSPTQHIGPARYTKAPCKIEDIPEVDAIVISHNHYDHLDTHTIKTLTKLQKPHIFAPLGNDTYFKSTGVPTTNAHCLDWWDSRNITVSLPGVSPGTTVTGGFHLTCTPGQHFTGRGVLDRFKTLWASWAVEEIISDSSQSNPSQNAGRSGVKVWFAGDTGYRAVKDGQNEDEVPCCPVFKEIGEKFGGFDLALIPIGAYLPRAVMSPVHCAPQDSVRIFKDVRAKRAIGMHWGTWRLTSEEVTEPPRRLAEECQKIGIEDGAFGVCGLGETVVI